MLDWSDWAGAYEIWLHRRAEYQDLIRNLTAHTRSPRSYNEPHAVNHLNSLVEYKESIRNVVQQQPCFAA